MNDIRKRVENLERKTSDLGYAIAQLIRAMETGKTDSRGRRAVRQLTLTREQQDAIAQMIARLEETQHEQ
jgi:hypothetical protein